MLTKISHFIDEWKEISNQTQQILEELSDETLSQEVAPGYRTIGRICWHLVQTVPEMMGRTGLPVSGPEESSPPPLTVKEIIEAYKQVSQSLVEAVQKKWTDESLLVEDDMYGEKWSRAFTCRGLINHQIYHLGQITVLMRQAGLKVPGIYGPSKEEWELFGMPAPVV